MQGVAHAHRLCGVHAALLQILQPALHLAFGIDIAKAQKLPEIRANAPCLHLMLQGLLRAGRKNVLANAHGLHRLQGGLGLGVQRHAFTGGQIILHICLRQNFIGMAGKIKPGQGIVILDGKGEDLAVFGQRILLRIAKPGQIAVEGCKAQRHVV